MKKFLFFIFCGFIIIPQAGFGDAVEQLNDTAQKSVAAVQTTSADKSKGSAADAFSKNVTNNCLCKAAGRKAFSCSCDNPLAIKGKDSASFKHSETDAYASSEIKPSDLIDQSSTASHIDPSEWKERNPQHVDKNNPFDVLKENKTVKSQDSLDDILSGKNGGFEKYEPSALGAQEDILTNYSKDNREELLKKVAANKKAANEAAKKEAEAKDSAPDAGDVIMGAVVGAVLTKSLNNTLGGGKKKSVKKKTSKKTSGKASSSSSNPCPGCAQVGCPDYEIDGGQCVCLCDDKVSVY